MITLKNLGEFISSYPEFYMLSGVVIDRSYYTSYFNANFEQIANNFQCFYLISEGIKQYKNPIIHLKNTEEFFSSYSMVAGVI